MKKIFLPLFLAASLGACRMSEHAAPDPLRYNQYVDPMVGTGENGHTYPGATVPFGMVQLSPDNGQNGWNWVSGYHYTDSVVVGFSHTHLSGTGIGDLQDISLMPTVATVDLCKTIKHRDDYDFKARYTHAQEQAAPGYYRVQLQDGPLVELTATERTGMHRYTFPASAQSAVVLNLGYAVNWDGPVDTHLEVVSDTLVTGYRLSQGWASDQRVYFALQFSRPFQELKLAADGKAIEGRATKGKRTLAHFAFPSTQQGEQLLVKVGLSSASVQGALKSLKQENPGWDFEQVKGLAAAKWGKELSMVEVEGGSEQERRIFYTALYHTKLAPTLHSDLEGAYKAADGQVRKAEGYDYYSTFSIWDTFRAAHPLFNILNPERVPHMVRSMVQHYKETGLLPVWTLAGNETNCMTGYHSMPILAEAILKGVPGIDTLTVYEGMKRTAMQQGRGVEHMHAYGFVPADKHGESVTLSLEYGYDDWCIAQVAKLLGKQDDYAYFMNRAMAYTRVFDAQTGFMRGKFTNGDWRAPFDPKYSSHWGKDADYTEGNAWQHTWFVPHDVPGLIALYGGNEPFVRKLDQLFIESSEITGSEASPDITGLIGQYAHGNEPSHHIAYMYNYAGAAHKTQQRVREIMASMYALTPEGLSGNEDCGQMSAWYVFSAMGFYPVNPVEGHYQLGSPLFTRVRLQLPAGKTFEVQAPANNAKAVYVRSAKLNGKALDRTYITHEELMAGGVLQLEMSEKP